MTDNSDIEYPGDQHFYYGQRIVGLKASHVYLIESFGSFSGYFLDFEAITLIWWFAQLFFKYVIGCSNGSVIRKHKKFDKINIEVNEQQNSATERLKTQLSYMNNENFMSYCNFFFWYKNPERKEKVSSWFGRLQHRCTFQKQYFF